MSSINKISGYTQTYSENCDFMWEIRDYLLYCISGDANILSPIFKVGSNDQRHFQLMFSRKIFTDSIYVNKAELFLVCVPRGKYASSDSDDVGNLILSVAQFLSK
ncbi:hypothetical protein TKK_0004592 [Trichogramma kaykai]